MAGSLLTSLGRGTILGYSTASTGPFTYTPLTKVVSVAPAITLGEVEDVTLDSNWESYLPTIGAGEFNFVIRHRPGDTGVKIIQTWVITPTIVHFQILFPDLSFMTFDGFVKGYSKTFENKTIVDADVPARITTAPVFTEAT
jgi:hypothetical protein